ncbi:MAG: hypothetical protein ACI3ZD_05995 [Prevotella sp.]
MKKKYITPECNVIEIEVKQQLLAGSGVEGASIYGETDQEYGF